MGVRSCIDAFASMQDLTPPTHRPTILPMRRHLYRAPTASTSGVDAACGAHWIITVGDGRTLPSHFDPTVLDAFKGCVGRFRDIFEARKDEG